MEITCMTVRAIHLELVEDMSANERVLWVITDEMCSSENYWHPIFNKLRQLLIRVHSLM